MNITDAFKLAPTLVWITDSVLCAGYLAHKVCFQPSESCGFNSQEKIKVLLSCYAYLLNSCVGLTGNPQLRRDHSGVIEQHSR